MDLERRQVFDRAWFRRVGPRLCRVPGIKAALGVRERGRLRELRPDGYTLQTGPTTGRYIAYCGPEMAERVHRRGRYLWALAHAFDQRIANPLVPAWNLGFDTLATKYSEAASDSVTGDIIVGRISVSENWATITAGAANDGADNGASGWIGIYPLNATTHAYLYRYGYTFDLSTLPACTVTAAKTYIKRQGGPDRENTGTATNPAFHIVGFTPADYSAPAQSDFGQFQRSTPFGSVAWDNLLTGANYYTEFVLNGDAYTAIAARAGLAFGLGCVIQWDVTGTPDADSDGGPCRWYIYTADSGVDYRPKLDVTYTVGATTGTCWGHEAANSALYNVKAWPVWKIDANNNTAVSGNASWGSAQIGNNAIYGTVEDTGNNATKAFTVTVPRYGNNTTGNIATYIRGGLNSFNQLDSTPVWERYGGSVTRTWQYVQLKIEKA